MLIGEVSEQTGISTRMLRHYDRLGVVSPSQRTSGGYRRYSDDDVRRLFHVEGLRSLGLSLPEAAAALADLSFSPATVVEELTNRTRERLAREEELLGRLEQVRAGAPTDWSDLLRLIGLIRGLGSTDPAARHRVALALGTRGTGADLAVEAALAEADPNVAGALYWALARAGDEAVENLAAALDSPLTERRHRAVQALTKIDTPLARSTLAAAHEHPDPWVRARATLARGRGGDLGAVPRLVALIADGRDDVEAADVLARLAEDHQGQEQISRLIDRQLIVGDPPARLRLTQALAEIPGGAATALLRRLTDDPERPVALTASAVLRTRPPG